jgi:hypothetical protein
MGLASVQSPEHLPAIQIDIWSQVLIGLMWEFAEKPHDDKGTSQALAWEMV